MAVHEHAATGVPRCAGWSPSRTRRTATNRPTSPSRWSRGSRARPSSSGSRRRYWRPRAATPATTCTRSPDPGRAGRQLWRSLGFADVAEDDVMFTETDLAAIGR